MNKYFSQILAAALMIAAVAFTSCKKDEKPKTVKVAAQVGTMIAGETQTVTFAVTTENIADGSYTPQVANLPTGVTAQGKVDITANKGTLSLVGSANAQAGTPNNLTLTIDGATSSAFTLTVTAATYSIGASPQTLPFGALDFGYEQPAAQTVTITNNGTGTVTLTQPNVANYTLGALSKTTLAAGETATFTVRPNANLAVGTYSPTININGSGGATATVNASFEVKEGVEINGVIWATRNVDAVGTFASKPESAGMFYQWNRKVAYPATGAVTGWNTTSPTGAAWESANDPSPDGWRVPTKEDIDKLLDATKVDYVWTTVNEVNGARFTDKATGKSIFLPAVGQRINTNGTLEYAGDFGAYWSSANMTETTAYVITFDNQTGLAYNLFGYGCSIRPVKK